MKKAVGIIGGMGPEASAYMYKLLIDMSISEFSATCNDDFPEVLLYSIPVPDFISSKKEKSKALTMLKKRVMSLNSLDISCLSIACNTAHVLLNELQKVSSIPFISMIEVVSKTVAADKLTTIGLLGTPSTIRSKIYQKALRKYNIRVLIPDEKDFLILEKIIRNIIKGLLKKDDKDQLIRLAKKLKERGVQGVILGCTELPLIFPKNFPIAVYNSIEILSRELLKIYYGTN